ncbi:MAG TPA: hypothetical protein VHI93_08775 [Candidatus Thermoplasmatota archaeon]|nr:hypothetical protein [Candidatus Thermoplasmatota archaeon]
MKLSRLALPLLALSLLLAAPGAAAQDPDPGMGEDPAAAGAGAASDPCVQPGKAVQCTGFGSIAMDSQRSIKGEPITLAASIWLNTNHADQGARWILFSVRNVTHDGSPVAIALVRFATPSGDVVTTRIDQERPSQLDLWVDVLDLPVRAPITLEVQVGSGERGAYRLEALVLAFDRAYETIRVDGAEASLFSSTLIGVNQETGKLENAGRDSLLQGKKTPGLALPALAAALGAALLLRRRAA